MAGAKGLESRPYFHGLNHRGDVADSLVMRTFYVIFVGLFAAACSDGGGFGSLGGGKSNDDKKSGGGSLETEDEPTTIPQEVSGSFLTDCVIAASKPAGLESEDEVVGCSVQDKATKKVATGTVKVKSLKLEFKGISAPHDVAKIVDGDATAHAYAGVPAGHARLLSKITAKVTVDGKDHTTVHTRVVEGPTPTALDLKPGMVIEGAFVAEAQKMMDDNPETAATADGAASPFIVLDLGKPTTLLFVKAFAQHGGGATKHELTGGLTLDDMRRLRAFDLPSTNNGDELAWVSSGNSVSVRYLKLQTTKATGSLGWREFQVFAQ